MIDFKRPEHRAVAAALSAMDHDRLTACQCWFGGEIVLELGEYRLSKDIDFLCSDADGYQEMRSLATWGGVAALFGAPVRQERAYGEDVGRKLRWVLERLDQADARGQAAAVLGMDPALVTKAVHAPSVECRRLTPGTR